MQLRKKTLIIISLTLVGMILLIYAASQVILMQSYTDIENKEVRSALNSSLSEINYDLSTLDSVTVDYAYWDDTYSYVQDGSPGGYIESNYVDATMLNQKLSVVVIVNATDQVAYARGYDLVNKEDAPVPAGIEESLSAGSPLIRSSTIGRLHGIIMLPGGPMMISAYPILKSDGEGTSAGTLIMGRFLSDGEIGVLRNMSGLTIAVHPYSEAGTSPGFEPAERLDTNGSGIVIMPTDADTVSGYALIEDIYGNPALVLRVDEPRTVYHQAQNALLYIVTSLLVSGIVFSAVMIFSFEKMVMSRMIKLNRSVSRIGLDTDISARVVVDGDDEVAQLADTINRTLDALETSRQRLQDEEQRLRILVENVNEVVWETNGDLKLVYVSPKVRDVMGYEPEDILGRSPYDLVRPGDKEQIRSTIVDMIARRGSFALVEFSIVRPDGARADIEIGGNPIRDAAGKIVGYSGIARDISERKRVEETMRQTNDELESRVQQRTAELKEANDSLESNVQQRTAELASAVQALQAEIAERKRVELQMMSSLQEKEVLLKEIHHRVKNNLQIISSLLSLQSENINSENPARTFRESQDRIRSMALIHEKLYQSNDISRIDFAEYVRSLTAYLFRSYVTGPGIDLAVDIDGISLDIDKAIPCGLIINELVSNSLKYAFPGGRPGQIYIRLTGDRNGYALVVEDNGAGLPPGLDFRNTPSLGLQLVNTLVGQLEGRIELLPGAGTVFRITFGE